MPQPADVGRAAAELIAEWWRADAAIRDVVASTVTRRSGSISRARREIGRRLDDVEAAARAWVSSSLPRVYAAGGQVSARAVGSSFGWSDPHRAAVQSAADEAIAEVRVATSSVRAGVAGWARRGGLDVPVYTPAQIRALDPGDLADLLDGHPVGLVRYRNGALHRLGDHGDMLTRTRAALTYNLGALEQGRADGAQFVEVFDGVDCGWSNHDDPDRANGTVRPIEVAFGMMLAHPRCQRSFRPRPDLTSNRAAKRAVSFGLPFDDEANPLPPAPPLIAPRARRPRRVPRAQRTGRAARGSR